MALTPASHFLVVTPTGDNTETEHGRIILVENAAPSEKVYRGVVDSVGSSLDHEGLEEGDVAWYTRFFVIHGKHVVAGAHLIASGE